MPLRDFRLSLKIILWQRSRRGRYTTGVKIKKFILSVCGYDPNKSPIQPSFILCQEQKGTTLNYYNTELEYKNNVNDKAHDSYPEDGFGCLALWMLVRII